MLAENPSAECPQFAPSYSGALVIPPVEPPPQVHALT